MNLSIPRFTRFRRVVRFILGPSTPTPDAEMRSPSVPLTTSFVLPNHRACTTSPDKSVYRLVTSCRLYYALIPVLMLWAAANVLLVREQYFSPSSPPTIGCTSALWSDWPPDSCGLNGTDCDTALMDDGGGRYRCLGGCTYSPLGNPRWVGGNEVNRRPLVIGGGEGSAYRADSWICASAIHAGQINPTLGGCVNVNYSPFPATTSNLLGGWAHNILSVPFLPSFPGSYTLDPSPGSGCWDLHPFISTFNALMLFLTTAFLLPSPPILISTLVILGWGQIQLISNPRYVPPFWEFIFAGLPPALLGAYWFYRVSFKRTLEGFSQLPVELALWQGIGYWIGIESSTIFARLPLTGRIGYDGIPPDGVGVLVVLILVVVFIAILQAWDLRKYGLLQYYIVRYVWLVPILIVLSQIPGYTLRIHHWFYPMLAIPVLSLPNRVSLFGQALMLGLFLDGIGRWGWAGIIQQTASLVGDANSGSYIPDVDFSNTTANALSWIPLPSADLVDLGITGVQVVVDDVLRLANYTGNSVNLAQVGLAASTAVEHYFRLAYIANGTSLDFTDPIIRFTNGSYSFAKP